MTGKSTHTRNENFDRLAVVQRLGGGLQTDVWLVDGSALGGLPAQVAIKTLKPSLAVASARQRLMHEGEILSRLSHPGLVSLLRMGVWAGEPALALEYLPLPSASADQTEIGAFSPLLLAKQLLTICRYLHEEHPQAPVIHGDIRIANLRFRGDGSPVLIDFASASLAGLPAPEGLGTHPAHASTARLDGAPATVADDLAALGRLLDGWICADGAVKDAPNNLKTLVKRLQEGAVSSASEGLRLL